MLDRIDLLRKHTTFAVLAGGASSRMGQDKALLQFEGKPLITRVLERGRLITDDVMVITNRLEEYRFLDVPLFPDMMNGKGPLVGLYTALHNTHRRFLVLVGCDMPFLNLSLLSYELQELEKGGYDIVVPAHDDIIEPLHAVYHKDGCLNVVKSALENGERSLIGWQGRVSVRKVEEIELQRFDPNLLCFTNLNTQQEYLGLLESMDPASVFHPSGCGAGRDPG